MRSRSTDEASGSTSRPRSALSAASEALIVSVAGAVDAERQVLFVLVLPAEQIAHHADANHTTAAAARTIATTIHRFARDVPYGAREPLRPFRDDILLFLADFSLPAYPCPRPARVFLIDGSSQMYRAYHAHRADGGLLRNARAQTDQRRLHLRDDAAQAAQRAQARVHRRVVRSARAARSATIWSPTTRPTARRCPTSSPSRSRWCTRRARRSACRSSPPSATRPTT